MSNTRRATGAKQPSGTLDLDAFEAEAIGEPFRFTLGGQQFELPHPEDLDWHDIGIGSQGGLTGHELLVKALGEQFAAFEKLGLSARGYNELQKRWLEYSGVSLGEGARSGSS